jgi:hypothetical protein
MAQPYRRGLACILGFRRVGIAIFYCDQALVVGYQITGNRLRKHLECLASAVECRRKADEALTLEARAHYLESMLCWLGLADTYETPAALRMVAASDVMIA